MTGYVHFSSPHGSLGAHTGGMYTPVAATPPLNF